MSILRSFLLVAALVLPLSASAGGLGSLFEILASQGGRTAAKIAAEDTLSASRTFSRTILAESQFSSISGREADQFERTLSRMAESSPEKLTPRLDALKSVLAQTHAGLHPLTHTATFDDALPFMRIRATGDPLTDDALAAFSRAKFEPMLAERFSVDDLRIIPLGMSEDAETSAKEVARYGRWIPAAQQDRVGPIAQLAKGEIGEFSEQTFAQLLVPYRGKTIILVGHIPESTQAFFVMTPQGMKSVDLDLLMKAANRAEVNIIPIGCNSGQFAPIGAAQKINSDDVLQRLVNVIQGKPSTILSFFKELSGSDLNLVLDPMDLNVFNNTISIVQKENQEVVGRIVTNAGREAVRFVSRRPAPVYDPCFQQPNSQDFKSCSVRVEADFKTSIEAEKAKEKAQRGEEIEAYRLGRINQIPNELVGVRQVTLDAARGWMLGALWYLSLWALAIIIGPYAAAIIHEQNETGQPLEKLVVNRRVVVKFLKLMATFWRANFRLILLTVPQFVVGVLVLLAGPFPDGFVPFAAGFGSLVLAWFCVGMLWNWLKEEVAGAAALGATVILIWLGSGWFYYQSAEPFWEAEARASKLKAELFAYTHQAQAQWRWYLPAHLAFDFDLNSD